MVNQNKNMNPIATTKRTEQTTEKVRSKRFKDTPQSDTTKNIKNLNKNLTVKRNVNQEGDQSQAGNVTEPTI